MHISITPTAPIMDALQFTPHQHLTSASGEQGLKGNSMWTTKLETVSGNTISLHPVIISKKETRSDLSSPRSSTLGDFSEINSWSITPVFTWS